MALPRCVAAVDPPAAGSSDPSPVALGSAVIGPRKLVAVVAVAAGLGVLGLAAGGALDQTAPAQAPAAAAASPQGGGDALTQAIEAAQQRLQRVPSDASTWAQLGAAYVEQARVTADPAFYPRAQGALERSLQLKADNNFAALAGMGALANARHDFAAAADYARRSQAINPAGATSWGVLADASIQLGDYTGASAAVQRMLDLDPGVASLTRASYDAELHGRTDAARSLLTRALEDSYAPADVAFCRYYLGQLAFTTGDLDGAQTQFDAGLTAVPADPSLLLGRARVQAARGDTDAALSGYEQVVAVRPLPEYLVEYGELLESLGRTDDAAAQYDLFDVTQQLFAANGVQDDLTVAQLAANRADPAVAVPAAQAERAARANIDSADALAWALHSAGRDAEALPLAVEATAQGARSAPFLYHRGVIEAALGMTTQARTSLESALATNPYFSPLHAPRAQAALDALGPG